MARTNGKWRFRALHRRRAFILAALALGLLLAGTAGAQPARWSAEEWSDDLDYLRVRVRTHHGNPFHTINHRALEREFDALHAAIPTLSDFEIAFGMQKIVASLGDGHSWFEYAERGLGRYFLLEAWEFSDGLYITRSGPGCERAVGCRITAVDGVSIESVREKLAPYISRDNEMDLLRQVPLLLRIAPALHASGIAADPDEATFTMVDDSGERFEQRFSATDKKALTAWEQKPPPGEVPLYRRKVEENYWYRYFAEDEVMYFQFNRFVEIPHHPFDEFLDALFGDIDRRNAGGLILDIRHNPGGWIKLLKPLLLRIRAHPGLCEAGHLYVLTSRNTFSAALMLAVRLERGTGAVFVGEPGRGKPNSYSEIGPFQLPNTGLLGTLSTGYFQESEPQDRRTRVEVDIPVALSYRDFRDGQDPVLDAALAAWRRVRGGEEDRETRETD